MKVPTPQESETLSRDHDIRFRYDSRLVFHSPWSTYACSNLTPLSIQHIHINHHLISYLKILDSQLINTPENDRFSNPYLDNGLSESYHAVCYH